MMTWNKEGSDGEIDGMRDYAVGTMTRRGLVPVKSGHVAAVHQGELVI